jgi:hypothetical protein
VRNLDRLDLGPEALAVAGDAGERRAEPVGAVVAGGSADQQRALGLSKLKPVAAREFRGGVDRIPSTRAEEHACVHWRQVSKHSGQL